MISWGLLLAVAAAVLLWAPWSTVYFLGPDDFALLQASSDLAAGHWDRLLAPQDVHVLPLFRLLRLWFDTHFPEYFHWLYRITLLAHLVSVVLIFFLCRRWFAAPASALVAATLFAWGTLGGDALLITSQTTYVLSLPFLLGALTCLSQLGDSPRPRAWTAGCLACLVAAVTLHSLVAAAAVCGLWGASWLLPGLRESRRLAGIACGVPLALAIALWLTWGLPGLRASPASCDFLSAPLAARVWDALLGTALHFGHHVWRRPPTARLLLLAALALGLLLFRLRHQPASRWILASLLLTAGPAFLIFLLRTSYTYSHSRYAYQTFLPVAVAAGALLDLLFAYRPLRPALIVILVLATPLYYHSQRGYLTALGSRHQAGGLSRDYFAAWKHFFDRCPTPLRLPHLEPRPGWTLAEIFSVLYPQGKPGITPLSRDSTHPADCAAFFQAAAQFGLFPNVTIGTGANRPPGCQSVP